MRRWWYRVATGYRCSSAIVRPHFVPQPAFSIVMPAAAGAKRRNGVVGFRPAGQRCYVGFVPSKSQRTESSNTTDQPELLTPGEVARELGIQERTVRRWAADDVIPAEHTPTGMHRVPASLVPALQQLIKDRVPLNARTLRGRFNKHKDLEEDRSQPKST